VAGIYALAAAESALAKPACTDCRRAGINRLEGVKPAKRTKHKKCPAEPGEVEGRWDGGLERAFNNSVTTARLPSKCAAAHEEWLSAQPQSCASSGMAMATPHTPQIAIGAPMLTFVMLRSRAATEAAVMLSP
jgi:hypothetical protein